MNNQGVIESEASLFEAVLCGITHLSLEDDPKLLRVNSAAAHIFGYADKDELMMAMGGQAVSLVYQYDVEIARGFFNRCRRTGRPVNFGHRILKKDGGMSYIMGTMSIITLEDGSQVIQSIFEDSGAKVIQPDLRKSILFQPGVKNQKRPKLVVAHGHHLDRQRIRRVLKEDYEIIEAENSEEVLAIMGKEKEEIAAIISDQGIMSQDDYRFMATLKRSVIYTSVPIIIVADEGEDDEEKLLSYGANEYLRKDYSDEVIKLRLANLLELRDTAIARNAVESIVDNLPGGIIICRCTDTITELFTSEHVPAIGGRTTEEYRALLKESPLETLVYEGDRLRLMAKIKGAATRGTPMEITCRILHKDGSLVWVHIHAIKIREEDHEPVYQALISPTTSAEKMYQNILDNSFNAISVYEEESGECLYINNEAAKLYALEEGGDRTRRGLLTEENLRAIFKGETLSYHHYVVKQLIPRNTSRHLRLSAKYMDYNGIKARMINIIDDTESYNAQKERVALYETEMSKQALQRKNTIGTAIFNLSQNHLVEIISDRTFNRPIHQETTLEEAAAIIAAYIPDADKRRAFLEMTQGKNLLENYEKGQRSYALKYRYRRKNTSLCWVQFNCKVMEEPASGDLLAFAYFLDVNDETIRQETLLKTLGMEIEYVGWLSLVTEDFNVITVGETNAFTPKLGKTAYQTFIESFTKAVVCPEDLTKTLACFDIKNLLTHLKEEPVFTFYYRTKSDGDRQCRKKMRVFYADDSKEILGFARTDITDIYKEQQEQNHRLELALEEARQANEAKSTFLSRMSHDIRTPMNGILGLLGLAMDEMDSPEVLEDYLKRIERSGEYLLGLINDILDMSKIESDRIELKPEPSRIEDCVTFVVNAMAAKIEKKNIHFTYQDETQQGQLLMLDKMRFQQIVFNLLSNAVKFTDPGGHIDFLVSILWEKDGCMGIRMEVRDDGRGIAQESLKSIFEPFEQGRGRSLNEEGTGLGLAIVKNLVRLMGGLITVESQWGEGAAFIVETAVHLADTLEDGEDPQEIDVDEIDFEGKRILVVEDHPINMEIATKLLIKKHCAVVGAKDGREALTLFTQSQPGEYDALLMDIRMPVMNGLESAEAIRALNRPDAKTVPIIAMTANAFDEDMRKTKEAGMNAHLSKPIEKDKMYKTLYGFLNDRGSEMIDVKDYSDLNEAHRDVLLELGNIGTGNALTALSQLTDQPIRMNLPTIRVVPVKDIQSLVGENQHTNVGINVGVTGDLECVVSCLFHPSFTKIIVEDLTGEALVDVTKMDEMQQSAVSEIGNIMCNAYLNALATMLMAEMDVSVPRLKVGSGREVLSFFSQDFVDEKAEILLVENTFYYLEQEFVSFILLHPKFESLRKILEQLED